MKTETLKVKLTFTEETLGTSPGNREAMEDYIASRTADQAKRDEEIESIPESEQIEKASTVFPRDETGLFAWDYQLRGMFKGAIYTLIELGDCALTKWAYKGAVDRFLFIEQRRVYYLAPDGQKIKVPAGNNQRPLRATTMQGDRVALARSECLPPGTVMEFTVSLIRPDSDAPKGKGKASPASLLTMDTIRDCLDYGKLVGFSQWRGGGFGRFTWEEVK
jgi:hypothetical protein